MKSRMSALMTMAAITAMAGNLGSVGNNTSTSSFDWDDVDHSKLVKKITQQKRGLSKKQKAKLKSK